MGNGAAPAQHRAETLQKVPLTITTLAANRLERRQVRLAFRAAADLAKHGISAEVVDLPSLAPLYEETILSWVVKAVRAVVVESAFDALQCVTAPDVHISFSSVMERPFYPGR